MDGDADIYKAPLLLKHKEVSHLGVRAGVPDLFSTLHIFQKL